MKEVVGRMGGIEWRLELMRDKIWRRQQALERLEQSAGDRMGMGVLGTVVERQFKYVDGRSRERLELVLRATVASRDRG